MSTVAAAVDKCEATRPASRKSSTTSATSARAQNGPDSANHTSAVLPASVNHSNSARTNSTPTHVNGRSSITGSSSRRPWRDQPNIGKYKLIRTLGRGNFAKVKLAEHVSTGRQVAVKVIDKTQLNRASLLKLFREVKIMKMLNHPNIVRLYEVIESERHVYLVMEYAPNGEVFDYLVTNGRMKEKEARAKFRQLVSAVEYCHWKKIVHRDLKAENLLLDKDFNIKLADFGFSNFYDGENKLDTFCGSPPYAAPELFQGQKYYGPEVDVWSLGVILYTLVSGSLPFDAQHLKELQSRVIRGKYRVPFYMSTDCELLLRKLLVLNPSKRKPLKTIMSDKWLNMGYEDNILEPYVEPPPDYNDPVRLAIMQKMGYQPDEVREALENQSFNNVTAIYLLLADPKTQMNLPAQSFVVRSAKESKSDALAALANDDSTPAHPAKVTNQENNSSIKVDTPANNSTDRKPGSGVSWLKQSASAGPTSSRTDRPSNDHIVTGLPHNQFSDTQNKEGSIESAQPNDETSLLTTDAAWIRRNNTFTAKKIRPSGSDLTPPDQTCPLSRAPQFSDIPNHLTSDTETITTSAAADSVVPRLGQSNEEDEPEATTLKTSEAIATPKTTIAVPYRRENATFSCHRPRYKPNADATSTRATAPDNAPVVRIDSTMTPAVVDMLNPEARHQFARNCPERATVAVSSARRPGFPAKQAVAKPLGPIEARDSVSSASTTSQADTLNGDSSSNTLNSESVRKRTNTPQTPKKFEGDTVPSTVEPSLPVTENRNLPRFKLPTNTTTTTNSSPITRDPMTQWSMRLRVSGPADEHCIPLTNESRAEPAPGADKPASALPESRPLTSDHFNPSATTSQANSPQLTTAKPYTPSPAKPGQFFRRITSRLSRSHTQGRADEGVYRPRDPDVRTDEPDSSGTAHETRTGRARDRPATDTANRLGSASELANPVDPWTARQRQHRPKSSTITAAAATATTAIDVDSHSGGTATRNGYHGDSADDVTLNTREKEPFIPRPQETHSTPLSSSGLAGSLGRRRGRRSKLPADSDVDSSSTRKPSKPRRLHFVYRLNVCGRDPNALLKETLRVLDQNSISYVHKNDYCLSCTNQTQATRISGTFEDGGQAREEDRLLHSEPANAAVLKWETEVCRLGKPTTRYGVKFKRLTGDSNAFKKMEHALIRQFTTLPD